MLKKIKLTLTSLRNATLLTAKMIGYGIPLTRWKEAHQGITEDHNLLAKNILDALTQEGKLTYSRDENDERMYYDPANPDDQEAALKIFNVRFNEVSERADRYKF